MKTGQEVIQFCGDCLEGIGFPADGGTALIDYDAKPRVFDVVMCETALGGINAVLKRLLEVQYAEGKRKHIVETCYKDRERDYAFFTPHIFGVVLWAKDKSGETVYTRPEYHSPLTANEYQLHCMRTAGKHTGIDLLLNGVMGLNGEAGECIDVVKKHLFQGHPLDTEKLAKELGDTAWYLSVTAHALGYTLEQVMRMNIDKLLVRYPDGFDPARSLKRKESDV